MARSAAHPPPMATRLAKALSHPLRQRILEILRDGVASPSEIAQATGERLGNVSYHVQMLLRLGCIELVRTEPRRGATEHYYRATVGLELEDPEWRRFPPHFRQSVLLETTAHLWSELAAAAADGDLERPDIHISRTPLQLDDKGWNELAERLVDLVSDARRIQQDSERRGGPLRPCRLGLLHFPTAEVTPTDREAGQP